MNDDRIDVCLQNNGLKLPGSKMNDHSPQQKILTVNMLLCQLIYVFRPPST